LLRGGDPTRGYAGGAVVLGDKRQLQAILKAAIAHQGLSVIDVISPCVTFNDHVGSTKSYSYMKEHDEPLQELDFVPAYAEISVEIAEARCARSRCTAARGCG